MTASFFYVFSLLALLFTRAPNPCHHTFTITHETTENQLVWSKYHKLSWADFEGQPDYGEYAVAALTASAISYRHHCGDDGYLVISVDATFKKKQSWAKPESYTATHLSHEQLHFDITELFARQLRKALSSQRFACHQTADLESLIDRISKNWRDMERRYDIETDFSLHAQKQQEWERYIDGYLRDFDAYALE